MLNCCTITSVGEPSKGRCPTEPLVDHAAERVLITGGTRMTFDLFGGHVGQRADGFFGAE